MRQSLFFSIFLQTVVASPLVGQLVEQKQADVPKARFDGIVRPTDLWSSRLTQELVDDFQMDSREKYSIQKEVNWQPGKLTLGQNSSVTIPVFGGPEAAVRLKLDESTSRSKELDLGIAIIPEEADGCTIEIQRRSQPSRGRCVVRLVEYREIDGRNASRLVREVDFQAPETINSLTVHYRYGVISLSMNDSLRMVSFVDRGATPVRGLFIGTQSYEVGIGTMKVRRVNPDAPPTADEIEQFRQLQAEYAQMIQLYQQGELRTALSIAQKMLPKLKPLLRKTAPQSLPMLNDIAFLHFQTGNTEKASELYRETLALYVDLPGSFHPEYARTLNNFSILHESNGDLEAAEKTLRDMAFHFRNTTGPESTEFVSALADIGRIRRKRSDFGGSLTVLQEAHEILVRSQQQNQKVYGQVLGSIGQTYTAQRTYIAAAEWCRRALKWNLDAHGEQSAEYIDSLINLANAEQNRDSAGLNSAVAALEQANDILSKSPNVDPATQAMILNNLGTCYRDQYRIDDAVAVLTRAAGLMESLPTTSPRELGMCLSSLGEAVFRAGDVDRAQTILERGYQLFVESQDQKSFEYARLLQARANVAEDLGDYKTAITFGTEVVEVMAGIRKSGHPDYCLSLQNLGAYYMAIGRYKDALELFEKAIGADPPTVLHRNRGSALSLRNAATIYGLQKRFQKARLCLEAALELNITLYGPNHPQVADSLNSLGAHFHDQGNLANAEEHYRRALKILDQPAYPDSTTKALLLENLGRMSLERGERDTAKAQLHRSLALYTKLLGSQHADRADVLHDLGRLAVAEGLGDEATEYFDEAFQLALRKVRATTSMQSARQQIWHQSEMRIHFFAFLTHALNTSGLDKTALRKIWTWKQAVTQRQAAYRRLAGDAQMSKVLQELSNVSSQLSATVRAAPQPPAEDAGQEAFSAWQSQQSAWKDQLRQLNRRQEQKEQRLAELAETKGIPFEAPELNNIQASLPTGDVIVEFVKYLHVAAAGEQPPGKADDVRYAACVVSKHGEPVLVEIGPASKLEEQIVQFRSAFTENRPSSKVLAESADAGNWLRENLWLPIEEHVGDTNTVLICPDGAIGILPIAALPADREGRFLLEDFRFAILPSASAIMDTPVDLQPSQFASLLLVGDIDYGQMTGNFGTTTSRLFGIAKPLPGTQKELTAIQKVVKSDRPDLQVTQLIGSGAAENRFLAEATQHQFLHVATHGFFAEADIEFRKAPAATDARQARLTSGVDPLLSNLMPGYLSGLALAGCNADVSAVGGSEDGTLHSAEIEAAALQNVDTVVLSACQTALGQEAVGEGLIGLQRAFHIAGVDTVIASLWKVDDQATAELMETFYTNLLEHRMSKLDALRDAQLQMLNQSRASSNQRSPKLGTTSSKVRPTKPAIQPTAAEKAPSPAYWAAFQLSGSGG